MANGEAALRELAKRITQVERRIRATGSVPQLANSSLEDGAIPAFSGDQQVMLIGRQWDGTYTTAVTNGPTPPTPSAPIITDGTEGISVRWDGLFADGGILPMDYLRVDIHLSQTDGFTPSFSNRYGTIIPPTGGEVAFHVPAGTWYAKLVCWSQAGVPSAASAQVEGDSWPIEVTSDGFAPSFSPDPEAIAGIDAIYVRWPSIANVDPVKYEVHISTTLGFTPDSTTLVGETEASMFTVKNLPGPVPMDGEEDTRKLAYDTAYYIRVVAKDEDGAAPPSLQAVGYVFRVTGVNLAVDSVTTQSIAAGSIVGEHFSATVIMAGTFKTAVDGQRIETGIAGIKGYKSDGSLMLNFPTDPNETALIDAEIIARGLTVTNGMVLRATSRVEVDAVVKLARGASAPINTPQLADAWEDRVPDTSGLTSAQVTGPLGTFWLIPSQVSFIEWKHDVGTWVVHQIRPNGTRAWFFDYEGDPDTFAYGAFFHDYENWEIWSVIEITTSSAAKNGVYRMSRWIPNDTYYLQCPQGVGFNRYSRMNSQAPPQVGTNGIDVFVAEVVGTQLNIRYFTPNGDGNNLSAPTTIYQSNAGFSASRPLSTVFYDAGGFDVGAPRYLVGERGFSTHNKLVYTSGSNAGSIHPGGVPVGASSWSSPNINAETFEVSHPQPRCIAWIPGDAFWTYGGDGIMRRHTEFYWDPATTSSTVWVQHTFARVDAGPVVYETTGGPIKSFTRKRRAFVEYTKPPIPGGPNPTDPNFIGTYVGKGDTQPAPSAMFRDSMSGNSGPDAFDDPPTSGLTIPTTSSFPNANPGRVESDDGSLKISGDGTIKIGGKDVALGTPTIQYITASGTWTKPAGLKAAYVECIGGGGGSGGLSNGTTNQGETGCGGGGSWNAKWYLASDLNATESVTIGAGGNAGTTAGTNGTNGGSTIFKGMTAGPGIGGTGYSTSPRGAALVVPGGAGGVATGGDINLPGEPGSTGRTITGLVLLQSRGGSSPMGYGFGGVINNNSGSGQQGSGYGSGGGAAWHGAGVAAAGVVGNQGLVKITMYF